MIFLLTTALPAYADEPTPVQRTWTASTGHAQVAAMTSLDAGLKTIDLKLEEGRVVTLSWSQLSEKDRAWIMEHIQANQPVPTEHDIGRFTAFKQVDQFSVPACAQVLLEYHYGFALSSGAAITLVTDRRQNITAAPDDVAQAMNRLGFQATTTLWDIGGTDFEIFERDYLPQIKEALFRDGPVYVTFRPGVIDDEAQGALIVSYDDERQRFRVYIPARGVGPFSYHDLSIATTGMIAFQPVQLEPLGIESVDQLIQEIEQYENPWELSAMRFAKHFSTQSINCAPWGTNADEERMKQAAQEDGEAMINTLLRANQAVVIPEYQGDLPRGLFMITLPADQPEKKWMVWHLSSEGWVHGEEMSPRDVLRRWAGPVATTDDGDPLWGLRALLLSKSRPMKP